MSQYVLQCIELQKTYFGKVDVPVLQGVDLDLDHGQFVAVMGQSGSGKSTLLNILGCLDRATGGKLLIHGRDVSELDDDELASLRSHDIGFVFQFHFLLNEFTCLENALMPILIRKGRVPDIDRDYVLQLLDRIGLSHRLQQHPDEMSGGENQRCAIVRALANRPSLILADEPTGNLDRKSGQEVFGIFREVASEIGVGVVLVTHDDRLAVRADRVLVMKDGRLREVPKGEMKPTPVMV